MVYHNKCSVPECKSESKVRHRFPNPNKDLSRFNEWINAINNVELMEMEPMKVYHSKRLCHDHFEATYVSSWSKNLFPHAVPTLNISGTTQSSPLNIQETPTYSTSIELVSGSSNQPSGPAGAVIDLDEPKTSDNNEGNKIPPMTPYRLLKRSGISRRAFTPKEKKMYEAMKQLHKKYTLERNRKKSFRRRLLDAEQFRTNHLEVDCSKLNRLASMFIECQLRECEKSKNLRRFTMNEKLLALLLYKQSAKSYSILAKIFILPSKSTLSRLLSEIVGGPGVNNYIFESLKKMTAEMDSSEKYVAILFDEMSIMPSLNFNEHLGSIEGFEDMGENVRRSSLADHVLVFMVRGIKKQWKCPISYHFSSNGGATGVQVKHLITKISEKLLNIGLKPITVICDQYNASTIKKLIQETREKYLRCGNISHYRNGSFEVGDFKVYPIFDPPHLLKGLRNNFIKKNLIFKNGNETKTAKWKHIEYVYEHDNKAVDDLKALPNLTDEHIYENKLRKMKVKNAAQIFSQRLAATIRLVAQFDRRCDENLEDTAELLYLFDRLFDSVNGSNKLPDGGKRLRAELTDTSDHLDFWNREALPILETMQFQKSSARSSKASKPKKLVLYHREHQINLGCLKIGRLYLSLNKKIKPRSPRKCIWAIEKLWWSK